MEKAWAFYRRNEGTYASIDSGSPTEVFGALGMSNEAMLRHLGVNDMVARIKLELSLGRAMLASTVDVPGDNGSDMTGDHLYLIDRLNTNAAGEVTSVRLYNPHGSFETVGVVELFDNSNAFITGRVA
jgi:hypothetical protein